MTRSFKFKCDNDILRLTLTTPKGDKYIRVYSEKFVSSNPNLTNKLSSEAVYQFKTGQGWFNTIGCTVPVGTRLQIRRKVLEKI